MIFPAFRDNLGVRLDAAGWVDDWAVGSNTAQGLVAIITLVSNMLQSLGMSLAIDKTSWLAISIENPPLTIYISGHALQRSTSVVYLGALLSCGGVLDHIDYRSKRMQASWGQLHRSLRSSGASRAVVLKAVNAVALPSLLWSLQAYPITGNAVLKLQSEYLPVLRSIFGSKNRAYNSNWIYLHSFIKQQFRDGTLRSPVVELYRAQERLHTFLQTNPEFDLHLLMGWRSNSWLSGLARSQRPVRRSSGTPPRQLDSEFLGRAGFSMSFRANQYAEHFQAPPSS